MPINLNLFTRLTPEGGVSQANKAAFQTSNFTPRTSKEIVANMQRLEAMAEAGVIEYGKPFYLPVVVTKAAEVSAEAGQITSIMRADGSTIDVDPELFGDDEEDDDDEAL